MHKSCYSSVHGNHHGYEDRCHEPHHRSFAGVPQGCLPGHPQPMVLYWPIAVCSTCRQTIDSCQCSEEVCGHYTPYVRELLASSSSASAQTFVGGDETATITLEFLADKSAVSPKVTLIIDAGEGETTVEESAFGEEYQSRSEFTDIEPGTRLSLTVQECTARIRWIEKIA